MQGVFSLCENLLKVPFINLFSLSNFEKAKAKNHTAFVFFKKGQW
jgi:hypothetical protein